MSKLPTKPENNKGKNMKKNKSKVPVVTSPKTDNPLVSDDMMQLMCKEFDKMTTVEKEQFKQQTLNDLRKSISDMVGDGSTNKNQERRPIPRVGMQSDLISPYAVNPHGKATVPEDDINSLIKQKPLNEQETELLRCKISEYLKSFAIFGYDLNGARVLITSCKTTQDRDAIFQMSTHIPPVIFSLFNGRDPGMEDMF